MDNNEREFLTGADVKNKYMGLLNVIKANTDNLLSIISNDIIESNMKRNVWQVIQNKICDIEEDFKNKGLDFYTVPETGLAKVLVFRLVFEGSIAAKELENVSAYVSLINQYGIFKIFYLHFIKKHMKEYIEMCDEISKYNFMDDMDMLLTIRYNVNDYENYPPHSYEKMFYADLEVLKNYAGLEYANNIKAKFAGVIEEQEDRALNNHQKTREKKFD